MSDPRNKVFKRKYHLKSRRGCLTCKARRVKCDETHPACKNCQRMKLECGYQTAQATQQSYAPLQLIPLPNASIALPGTLSGVSLSIPTANASGMRTPVTDEETPKREETPSALAAALGLGLLSAGNLNNINLSHLVNNLSGIDLGSLGGVANLNSLAVLAQLPIDLTNLGGAPAAGQAGQGDAGQAGQAGQVGAGHGAAPKILPNAQNPAVSQLGSGQGLNMLDLRLMYHYTTQVSPTITGAGISDTDIWNHDVPMLAFEYPFLMHAVLAFSATHLLRTEKGLDQCVTGHRGDALRLLREAILDINSDNTDALVASALILIMDSLANAAVPLLTSPQSLPASAWIFHVKGAATILTAVWPLTEALRFYKFISVDLGDLGDIINEKSQLSRRALAFADLECHDLDIADLYPVAIELPYLVTLAYLNKLHKERYKADFILRIFAFPALLDKDFMGLLMLGDVKAMRIMRLYYKLLRSFTMEMRDKVWFLEGVSQVLPLDVEEYAGGAGGMHMMLDFLGGGPAIVEDHEIDKDLLMLDPEGRIAHKLIDTDNLPSDITSSLDVMQGDEIMGELPRRLGSL